MSGSEKSLPSLNPRRGSKVFILACKCTLHITAKKKFLNTYKAENGKYIPLMFITCGGLRGRVVIHANFEKFPLLSYK